MQALYLNNPASQQAPAISTHYIDPKVKKAFEIVQGVIFLRHSRQFDLTTPQRIGDLLKTHTYCTLELSEFAKIAKKISETSLSEYQAKQIKKKVGCPKGLEGELAGVSNRVDTYLESYKLGELTFDEKLEGFNEQLEQIQRKLDAKKEETFLIKKKIVTCQIVGLIFDIMKGFHGSCTSQEILCFSSRLTPLIYNISLEQFFPSAEADL